MKTYIAHSSAWADIFAGIIRVGETIIIHGCPHLIIEDGEEWYKMVEKETKERNF